MRVVFAVKAIMHSGGICVVKDGFDRHNAAQKAMAADASIRKVRVQFGWTMHVGRQEHWSDCLMARERSAHAR